MRSLKGLSLSTTVLSRAVPISPIDRNSQSNDAHVSSSIPTRVFSLDYPIALKYSRPTGQRLDVTTTD